MKQILMCGNVCNTINKIAPGLSLIQIKSMNTSLIYKQLLNIECLKIQHYDRLSLRLYTGYKTGLSCPNHSYLPTHGYAFTAYALCNL